MEVKDEAKIVITNEKKPIHFSDKYGLIVQYAVREITINLYQNNITKEFIRLNGIVIYDNNCDKIDYYKMMESVVVKGTDRTGYIENLFKDDYNTTSAKYM